LTVEQRLAADYEVVKIIGRKFYQCRAKASLPGICQKMTITPTAQNLQLGLLLVFVA